MTISLADYLARHVERVLATAAKSVDDLSAEDVNFRPHANANSLGFEAWHVARTADNLVHFAFEREKPIWVATGLHEQWGLPKVDQGTGMSPEDAYALQFPAGPELAQYCRDVAGAIVPRIRAMTDEYLESTMEIKPQGEMQKLEIIGQVIVNHGNNHLGQLSIGRTVLGKPGLGF